MLKPGWLVNGVFGVIALLLIMVDVQQRSAAIVHHQAQIFPVQAHK